MISKIYWINHEGIGQNRIGTMARPRGNDWLDDEIKWLKHRGVDCLVSLLEKHEEWELDLSKESEVCINWGIEFINFPIEDVKTPKNRNEFIQLAHELSCRIKAQKTVVIHCRMGIGRSSMLASAILIHLGFTGEYAFELISKQRKLKVPDTEEQKEWIIRMEDELKN